MQDESTTLEDTKSKYRSIQIKFKVTSKDIAKLNIESRPYLQQVTINSYRKESQDSPHHFKRSFKLAQTSEID